MQLTEKQPTHKEDHTLATRLTTEPVAQNISATERYLKIRSQTEALCAPLAVEDMGVQPMEGASPPKWHLAHTSWFFETFILKAFGADYQTFHPMFEHLFNSYYNGVGTPYPRAARGNLSRPTVAEVQAYRRHVDARMGDLLEVQGDNAEIRKRLDLGMNHEQQHQELILTDLKYNFGHNPLHPVYRSDLYRPAAGHAQELTFSSYAAGMTSVGATEDFCFDNELPRHPVYLGAFQLADRLITNAEYLAFIDDRGYHNVSHWLSDGWTCVGQQGWQAPLYWKLLDGSWCEYTLSGLKPLVANAPVTHVSGFEADAFARWAGARLPTEHEWERAAGEHSVSVFANLLEADYLHPQPAPTGAGVKQLFGDGWEWTSSSYGPYPGYRALAGTLGKFMASQLVLRGGSCATPRDHIRHSYRNFFYPPDRWQFSCIRLARDL
ncbi:MAG: ergothioneine biosynthesis protein EgtB [Proteobacteria bacterium]|nr:ergothioneine biosynthesis protein EgtB [Pseudomonadota bacterium]